tara:strand:+ start:1015 stop:1203 length:189 start_codon:yes stop_codon:yes gene_type:complete
MNQTPQRYQQVLHRLQRLRGDLLNQRCSVVEIEAELDGLLLSIEQDLLICRLEVEKNLRFNT